MALQGSDGFRRAKSKRKWWIVGASTAAAVLGLLLVPQWLQSDWLFYPLPTIVSEIAQNFFWAFSTSVIFMAFESSVNGGASLIEKYREIVGSVGELEGRDFKREVIHLIRVADAEESDRLTGDMSVLLVGGQGYLSLLHRWWDRGTVRVAAVRAELDDYKHYLLGWQRRLESNDLIFVPKGLPSDFSASMRERARSLLAEISEFDHRLWRVGNYWILEEDIGQQNLALYDTAPSPDELADYLAEAAAFDGAESLFRIRPVGIEGDPAPRGVQTLVPHPDEEPDGYYARVGDSEDWGKMTGSRALDQDFPNHATISAEEFWLTPPARPLTFDVFAAFNERMVTLAEDASTYNELLQSDLQRARAIALA